MEEKYIIYPNEYDTISVLISSGEIPIEEVAKKDVPKDVPYRFITQNDFPKNSNFRNAWESDFSEPDGYGMGPEDYFAQKSLEQNLQNN